MEPIRLWRIYCDGWNYTDDEEVSKIGEPIAALPRAEYDALVRRVENAEVAARVCREDAEENAARAERAERDRDAYRRAKAENDERYMVERDAATARAEKAERERDDARAALDAQIATVLAAHLDVPTDDDRRGEDGA